MIAIRAGKLIDCTGKGQYGPATLLIESGKIVAIGPTEAVAVPEGARILAFDRLTLLPGLIDVHTHYGIVFQGIPAGQLTNYEQMARGIGVARRCLISGVTTARTVGERDYLDLAYRRAIEEGWAEGPRTLVSGRILQPSHSKSGVCDVHVDGADEVRRLVRQNLLMGVDLIKMFLTPNNLSATPTLPYFTMAEIHIAVDEAHRAGKPIAVHCQGGPAADDCISAGVDTIEHGVWLTPTQMDRMAQKGIWLVATQAIRLWEPDESRLPERLRKARTGTISSVRAAREAGVKVTVGTDGAHGLLSFEIECLNRAGYSPMEALLAGTKHAAEAIGLGSSTGTLEVGKWADVIGVVGNPLADIRALRDVAFVMKSGKVFLEPSALSAGTDQPASPEGESASA
ncbi:MAG: amidohydrolase family protein [Chloroflexota bacterium]